MLRDPLAFRRLVRAARQDKERKMIGDVKIFKDGPADLTDPVMDAYVAHLEYQASGLKEDNASLRRLLESKQEELAREQKLREDREKAHHVERIQWRESLREKDEETQRWRRKYEAKEWR
jgi:arylsulfatase A-like enzyme